MNRVSLSLVCVILLAVQSEPKSIDPTEEQSEEDKSSEKRWIQSSPVSGSVQPQATYSDKFAAFDLQERSKGQERAKEEKTFKDFIAYDAIQNALVNALKPKPIIDTAEESEKLAPNDGSGTQFLGDLIVRGSETISRALNKVIDGPKQAITKLSAGATQALNQLGAYLVGL